jgi:lysine 2,3-aminomutase
VKPGEYFLYFDPIDLLAPEVQARWAVPELQERMIADALARAGGTASAVA